MAHFVLNVILCCWAAFTPVPVISVNLAVSGNGHFNKAGPSIPWQLVMTGKEDSLEELPEHLRKNVERTLALNPGMKAQYLSDSQCRIYVRQHADDEMAEIYNAEHSGHFRGDICRAVVLFREGGFYADIDLEPTVPFKSLVDDSTTFMSVFTDDGFVLNALMAVVPDSTVMKETLQEIRRWYKGDADTAFGHWMGTATMKRALQSVMKTNCPGLDFDSQRQTPDLQWPCGPHNFRFYQQQKLRCPSSRALFRTGLNALATSAGTPECPLSRMKSRFEGLRYGLFTPGESRHLIGWSRTASCDAWWCGGR